MKEKLKRIIKFIDYLIHPTKTRGNILSDSYFGKRNIEEGKNG